MNTLLFYDTSVSSKFQTTGKFNILAKSRVRSLKSRKFHTARISIGIPSSRQKGDRRHTSSKANKNSAHACAATARKFLSSLPLSKKKKKNGNDDIDQSRRRAMRSSPREPGESREERKGKEEEMESGAIETRNFIKNSRQASDQAWRRRCAREISSARRARDWPRG